MKGIVFWMCVLLTSISFPVLGQRSHKYVPNRSSLNPQQKEYIREREKILEQKLELSDRQRKAWKELKQDTRKKVHHIKNDNRLDRDTKKHKLDKVIIEAKQKRDKILTPHQREILYQELEYRKLIMGEPTNE